jgi:hypothetical protein
MKIKLGFISILLVIILFISGLWVSNVRAQLIDFNSLAHGEIVNTQFAGVTISAINVGGGPDLAVAFDSTQPGTADPDLEKGSGWSGGNLPNNTDLGKFLIIQENTIGINPGGTIVGSPDDEGDRPAGSIFFDFHVPITSFGFDLIDVEGPDEYGKDSGFFMAFYSGDSTMTIQGFGNFIARDGADYGNNTINRIAPFTAAELGLSQFDEVEINFGGSAAIDNIRSTPVPEPATMLLLGSGLIAIAGVGRKKILKREGQNKS